MYICMYVFLKTQNSNLLNGFRWTIYQKKLFFK